MRPADEIVLVAVLVMVGTVMMVIVMSHLPFTAVKIFALAMLTVFKLAVLSVDAGVYFMS